MLEVVLLFLMITGSVMEARDLPILSSSIDSPSSAWEKPGCHLLGHSREVSIPGCSQFSVVTNGCRGFCPSLAFPSLRQSAPRPLTSLGQCCTIMDSQQVTVLVLCLEGPRNVTFHSATSCSCYHCRKL